MAFVPLLVSFEGRPLCVILQQSYFAGVLFFLGSMYWFSIKTPRGLLLLVSLLAVAYLIWGGLVARLLRRPGHILLWAVPSAWVLSEYLRGHLLSGFGANLLAHTQWNWTPIIQFSDGMGVYGVSFLVMMGNVALYLFWRRKTERWTAGAFLICLLACWTYGQIRLGQVDRWLEAHRNRPGSFQAAVLQGNIPQAKKWNPMFRDAIWARYRTLTRQAAAAGADLIIWPETSVPHYPEHEETMRTLRQLAREVRTPLLLGAARYDPRALMKFNSTLLMGADGNLLDYYDKIHLVPFGEFVPCKPWMGSWAEFDLPMEVTPGNRWTVFDALVHALRSIAPFSTLICVEDVYPALYRRFLREGARWLVVVTNDAWFEHSAASLQHLQASVFRAVEGRCWVARAANTGWSGFVDPAGRRLPFPHQVPRFKPGWAQAEIVPVDGSTFYSRWGDWLIFLAAAAMLGVHGMLIVNKSI